MNVDQGGISLPDRDYYLKDDPKNVETREKYVAHMTRMFTLAGDTRGARRPRARRACSRSRRGSRRRSSIASPGATRTTAITG